MNKQQTTMGFTEQQLFDSAWDRIMRKIDAKTQPNRINRIALLHKIEDVIDTDTQSVSNK